MGYSPRASYVMGILYMGWGLVYRRHSYVHVTRYIQPWWGVNGVVLACSLGNLWHIPKHSVKEIFPTDQSPSVLLFFKHIKHMRIYHTPKDHRLTLSVKHSKLTSKHCTVFSDLSKVDSASFFSAKRLLLISYTIQPFVRP